MYQLRGDPMTWDVSSLHKYAPMKLPTTIATNSTNTSNAPNSSNTTNATNTKPKTAADFAKMTFSGKSENTGLATVNSKTENTNSTSRVASNNKPAVASSTDQLSTDKKREIMNNMQKDIDNRNASNAGSASKKAAMNNVAKTLKGVDLKEASDKDIEKLFTEVQDKLKAAQPNQAYQTAAQLTQMQSNINRSF